MLEKLIEAMNQREHEKFPSNTINPEYEKVKAVTLQSGKEMDNRAESTRLPDLITSARMKASERSYDHIPESEPITSARNNSNERSFKLQQEGSETESFIRADEDDDDLSYKGIKVWWEAVVVHKSKSVTTVTDVFDEDPHLGVLFADEDE